MGWQGVDFDFQRHIRIAVMMSPTNPAIVTTLPAPIFCTNDSAAEESRFFSFGTGVLAAGNSELFLSGLCESAGRSWEAVGFALRDFSSFSMLLIATCPEITLPKRSFISLSSV